MVEREDSSAFKYWDVDAVDSDPYMYIRMQTRTVFLIV